MSPFWHRKSKTRVQRASTLNLEGQDDDNQPPDNSARPTKGTNIKFESDPEVAGAAPDGAPVTGSKPTVWSMYLEHAFKLDLTLVERWREDMDSLLLFSAIFAASVTAFIIESYKNLKPDSNELTASLLFRISGQLSQSNESLVPPLPPPFHPSASAILCNICWFLSLILSLSCALGAILVRQWVLNYLQNTQNELLPSDRARMRHYLFMGVTEWKFATFVETLPIILHLSLFSFFLGLIAFISEVSRPVTVVIVVSCVTSFIIYMSLTVLPLLHLDCPYGTPLSSLLLLVSAAMETIGNAPQRLPKSELPRLGIRERRRNILTVSVRRHELDVKLFRWLWSLLSERREIVLLLNAIPDFIQLFPESLRNQNVPHHIVMDSISAEIDGLIRSSVSLGGKSQVPRSMESIAVACTGAMTFMAHTSAVLQTQIDWSSYFSLNSTMWRALHELSLRNRRRPTKANVDLALQAHGFILLVTNYQLCQSRCDPPAGNAIATLRRKVYDRLCDTSTNDHWSPEFLQEVSDLCRMCWLQNLIEWGEEFYGDIDQDWASKPVDMPYDTGRPEHARYGRFSDVKWVEHISLGQSHHIKLVHVAVFGSVFKWSLDADYLLLLHLALKQKWLYAQDLSEDQTQLALATMIPIAKNARITFATDGRRYTTRIHWFFDTLSSVIYTSTDRFAKIFSPLCAIVLFPDCEERTTFQDRLLLRLSQSSLDSRHTLLDFICECLRELVLDSHLSITTSALRLLEVCIAVGMPRNGEDLHCMLHKAENYRRPDFLCNDILTFRSVWLSCLCKEGTLADICSIINILPDPIFHRRSRAFLRVLLSILDTEDVSFMKQLEFLDDWVWDQLPPRYHLSGVNKPIPATKRIGSRPMRRRQSSISLPLTHNQKVMLRVGIDPSNTSQCGQLFAVNSPRTRSRSLPRSWTDNDRSHSWSSFNRYGSPNDEFVATEVWRQRVETWVRTEEKREHRRRRRREAGRQERVDDSNFDSEYDHGYDSDTNNE